MTSRSPSRTAGAARCSRPRWCARLHLDPGDTRTGYCGCTPRTSILRWSFQAEPCDDQGRGRLRCGTQSPWRHHFAKRDQKISVDGDEVCVIYDFVTDTPVGPVPSVEWIGMRNGKIKSVRLTFHSLEWPAIREEALRRAKVATATPAPNRRAGSAMGPQAAKFGHLGWPACINIAKCLQLVRTAESFAAPASIMGSNFVAANSDSSADPFAILDLPSAPNRIWEWRSPRERAGGPTGRRRAGSGSYREDIQ